MIFSFDEGWRPVDAPFALRGWDAQWFYRPANTMYGVCARSVDAGESIWLKLIFSKTFVEHCGAHGTDPILQQMDFGRRAVIDTAD